MVFIGTHLSLIIFTLCICTHVKASARVVGGRNANPGEVPYQLILETKNGFPFCGASLIQVDSVQVAITSAFCSLGIDHAAVNVVAGELDLTGNSGTEQRRAVSFVRIHPDYGYGNPRYAHDIALVFFEQPFELNDNVSTITLPSPSMKETSEKVVVTGWGQLSAGGPIPSILQLVEIPVVRDDICKAAWNRVEALILDNMLCAGTALGNQSPCLGDSGSPAKDVDKGFLAGIVSFGYPCGHPDFPGVFTEVAYFLEWIESEVASYKANREQS